MLVNISNHPSESWPSEQIEMAIKLFGEIVDFPFPQINPESSTTDISQNAQLIASELIGSYNVNNSTIHVMGELTFCFALVHLLQSAGFTCIASTTQRIANWDNGTKVSRFNFIQFRAYPDLV